jgi:hypothetical protein
MWPAGQASNARLCAALTLAALIAGCGLARQRELAAQMAALREQSAAAMKECGEKFPPGNPKMAVARAQCVNAALVIVQPTLPYPDLLQVYMADHMAVAEDIQAGRTSIAQGNAVLARKWSELVGEEQRRRLANRAVTAQEQTAAAASSTAAASWQAAGPRTCNYGAGTITCF